MTHFSDRDRDDIHKKLTAWYRRNRRPLPWRDTRDPYRIWVSEVMLQQTRVETVLHYYEPFVRRFPTVTMLASSRLDDVLKSWERMGYYGRARNLHRAAGVVAAVHSAVVPHTWSAFRQLPGVGDYIAAAVLSIAFGQPYAVVDGNVKRVLARLTCNPAAVNGPAAHRIYREDAQELLDCTHPDIFNQAIMELGALVCTPGAPRCGSCPLDAHCRALQTDTTPDYPKRQQKKPTPLRHYVAGIVEKGNTVLLARRADAGLLGGLWEFPGGEIAVGQSPAAACEEQLRQLMKIDVAVGEQVARIRHAFTHFRLTLDVFRCRHVAGRVRRSVHTSHRWVRPQKVAEFALPKTHLDLLPLLKK